MLCAVSIFGLLSSQAIADVFPSAGPTAADRKALAALEVASVSDHDLGKMRGGFDYNGLNVNFGLYTRTAIDGIVHYEHTFSTDPETATNVQNFKEQLQQIVKNGSGNNISHPSSGPSPFNFEGPLSVIQNTVSNTVIQHLTALSVDVTGAHLETMLSDVVHTNLGHSINNSMMLSLFH